MANQFGAAFEDDVYNLEDLETEINDFASIPSKTPGKTPKSPSSTTGLKGDDLKKAVAAKYNLKLKVKPQREGALGASVGSPDQKTPAAEEQDEDLKPIDLTQNAGLRSNPTSQIEFIRNHTLSIGNPPRGEAPNEMSPPRGATGEVKSPKDEEVELRRGFKYFLYHHHSCLGVFCVKHANDLPRYARLFLFLFDLEVNLMFALTLRETGMDIPARLFLTVFLCLIISFLMSILFKNCGFNRMFSGAGCVGKCVTIGILMVIPATICGVVIVIYLFRQEDNGAEAGILFVATTVLSLLLEILLWYFVYDCCKAYCSCFLCCCPNLLDDAEVAAADVAHAKKKAKLRAM
mmetsp:Transcript_7393/g.14239  ORF Transcript_7393/g.14239 Transcript_7393/m.14239 type:complete len:348 (-) Transcript_7393:309-1352(-)